MQVYLLQLLAALALVLVAVDAAPTPKNVFRPENIGMGYRNRQTTGPLIFPPFPGAFGRILGPEDAENVVDEVDKVDRVDPVDRISS